MVKNFDFDIKTIYQHVDIREFVKKIKQAKGIIINLGLLNDFSEKSTNNIELILVSDYNSPGSMVNAKSSTYLISQEIKSPMGAFLSALSDENSAKELLQEKGGKIYTWTTIKEKYSVK